MSSSSPKVSIIVRTQNRPKQLLSAIKSIARQYYHHIEVVLVNDGGEQPDLDQLRKILKNKSLVYLENKKALGRSAAGNLAMDKISGEYFGFLDDDDELLSPHVSNLVGFLENSDYLIAYADVNEYQKTFDRNTHTYQLSVLHQYSKDFNHNELILYNYIPFNALLFHRSVIKNERLDTQLELYEDWDFLIRLGKKYPFYHLAEVSAHYYKWHEGTQINTIQNIDLMQGNQNRVIQRYQHWLPANFLRQNWSYILEQRLKEKNNLSIDQLSALNQKLKDSINELEQDIENSTEQNENYIQQIKEHNSLIGACKREKDARIEAFEKQIKLLHEEHSKREVQLKNEYDSLIHEKNLTNNHLQNLLQQSRGEVNQIQSELNFIKTQLHHINISLSWRIMNRLRRLILAVFPENTLRRKLFLSARLSIGRLLRAFRPGSAQTAEKKNKVETVPEPVAEPQIAQEEPPVVDAGPDIEPQGVKKNRVINDGIIIVSHDFHRAGAQINILNGGRILKEKYHKTIIFVALKDGIYRETFEAVGDEVYALFPNSEKPFTLTPEVEQLFADFKARGLSQCICNTIVSASMNPLLSRLGFSFINLIHELPVSINIYHFHHALNHLRQYGKSIVFSSQYAQNSFIQNYQIDKSKTTIKPQGCYFTDSLIEHKKQAGLDLRQALFLPSNSVIIMTCGHLYFRKGPDVFLSLAKKILSRDINDLTYHFVWLGGHEYDDKNWFLHDAQKLGIADNIHYVDFVENPTLYYAGADAFVLTSREDPLPTVVMEAMNNGTPVLAFHEAGGIPEMLKDDCGIAVPFLDTDAMARELLLLFNDRERYALISRKAKKKIDDEFNFEQYMGFLLQLLKQQNQHNALVSKADINPGTKEIRQYVNNVLTVKETSEQHLNFETKKQIDSPLKFICFYLPQFHPIPENNAWWGEGFTEWTNVTRAKPQFIGHYQPRLPADLGFYDLRMSSVMEKQVAIAKNYAIDGFCFYYYWFSGRRVLEKPIDNFFQDKSLDLPFCLCWANENWSRRWDGSEDDILLEQKYLPEDDVNFIQDISVYFSDERYIKIENKPVLIIYRPDLLPDPVRSAQIWRQWCRENSIGEIFIANVQSFDHADPRELGYDAAIEFPPNLFPVQLYNDKVDIINPDYAGKVYHYPQLLDLITSKKTPAYPLFRGVTPGWDNEARRSGKGTSFIDNSPQLFKQWLEYAAHEVKNNLQPEQQFVFINAWNEWAEGAYLEPDQKYGFGFLDSCYQVKQQYSQKIVELIDKTQSNIQKESSIAVILHLFYFELWDEIHQYLSNIEEKFDLYVSVSDDISSQQIETLLESYPNVRIYRLGNKGRDIFPFLHIFTQILAMDYDCICKIHSKKSPHTDVGDQWRLKIFDTLLGSQQSTAQIIDTFRSHSNAGIIAPQDYLLKFYDCVGFNEEMAQQNMTYINPMLEKLQASLQDEDIFVTGSMFWFRPEALRPLMDLDISDTDYPVEAGQIDGTIMHALERVLVICARGAGFETLAAESLGS